MLSPRTFQQAPAARQSSPTSQADRGFGDARESVGTQADSPRGHDFASVSVQAPAPPAGGAPIQMWPEWEDLKKMGKGILNIPSDTADAYRAVRGSQTGPLNEGPRSDLASHLQKYPNPQFFTKKLGEVNRGLGLNTSAPLPDDKAKKYIHDSSMVESGQMLGSTAFFRSSADWLGRGNYPAFALNALGGMASAFSPTQLTKAMAEDRRRKTGR